MNCVVYSIRVYIARSTVGLNDLSRKKNKISAFIQIRKRGKRPQLIEKSNM
jgi:hypothetical protein